MNDRVSEAGGFHEPLTKPLSILTFRSDGQVYALPVTAVHQLIEMVAITAVPEAPPAVQGVINVHGEIVVVMDLRLRLGSPYKPYHLHTPVILMQANGRTLALVVDDVETVIDVNPADLQTGATVFDFSAADCLNQASYFSAIARVNNQIIIIIDADCLLSSHLEAQLTSILPTQEAKHAAKAAREKEWTGV